MCYENLNFLLLDLIEPLLCGRCGEMPKITADGLVSLLEVDCHGEANSNSRQWQKMYLRILRVLYTIVKVKITFGNIKNV